MPSHDAPVTGKSPYQRSNRTWRARGTALVVTVVILLVAAAAWITTYTRAVEHAGPVSNQSPDPAAVNGGR